MRVFRISVYIIRKKANDQYRFDNFLKLQQFPPRIQFLSCADLMSSLAQNNVSHLHCQYFYEHIIFSWKNRCANSSENFCVLRKCIEKSLGNLGKFMQQFSREKN